MIAIYCVLFAILSWRRLNWALALVVFALPSYLIRFQLGFVPMTLLEAMILILFAVWLIRRLIEKDIKINFGGYGWLIFLFLLSATIAIFVSTDRTAALGIWKAYFIEPIMFFVVLVNAVKNQKDWRLVIWALGFSALVVGSAAIFQKFTGFGILTLSWFNEETRRVTSWFGYPNAVGLYLAPIVVLVFGIIKLKNTSAAGGDQWLNFARLVFYFLVVAVSLFAIIFAKSEGALAGILAGIIFLGLFYPNKKFKVAVLVSLILLVSLVLLVPTSRIYAIEKLTFSDISGQIRLQQWKETVNMLKDSR